MIVVLFDLLADYSIRIDRLCIEPKGLQKVNYLAVGPGGAGNVAITAARLGLDVVCLGELGDDTFGQIVLDGLASEGINTEQIVVTPGARTPVAHVLVDERGEPAYLGYPGSLGLHQIPAGWLPLVEQAEAVYCDGWIEYEAVADLILELFRRARAAGVPTFFDPGPGNPAIDNGWQKDAAALASVLLLTEEEGQRLTGHTDAVAAGRALLKNGAQMVILKRGVAGSLLLTGEQMEITPGFPVEARDATGAGDSFAGATLYGYLKKLPLNALGTLGNATGAAKVQKLGTGHNMPTPAQIRDILQRFAAEEDVRELLELL